MNKKEWFLPSGRFHTLLLWLAAIMTVGVVVILAVVYSGYLGTRVAPGLAFRVTGPDALIPGEEAIVTWDTRPDNQKEYPAEKIEFCRGRLFGDACVTLLSTTPNDGEATVPIPALSSGSGVLRLTARLPDGRLVPSLSMVRSVEVLTVAQNNQVSRTPSSPSPSPLATGTLHAVPAVCAGQATCTTTLVFDAHGNSSCVFNAKTKALITCGTSGTTSPLSLSESTTFELHEKQDIASRQLAAVTVSVTLSPSSIQPSPSFIPVLVASPSVQPSPSVSPSPLALGILFLQQAVLKGDPISVNFALKTVPDSAIICQEWYIDDQPIPSSMWLVGVAPGPKCP